MRKGGNGNGIGVGVDRRDANSQGHLDITRTIASVALRARRDVPLTHRPMRDNDLPADHAR
jgi:hypothetical protein